MKDLLSIIACVILAITLASIVTTILFFTYKYYESHITIAKEIREIRLILEEKK